MNENMFRCPHCGQVQAPGANFCANCGRPMSGPGGAAAYNAGGRYYGPSSPAPAPTKANPLGIVGFLLGLLGLLSIFLVPYPFNLAGPGLGFLLSIIGTCVSHRLRWGNGLAVAGIVLSLLALLFALLLHFIWASLISIW